MTVAAHPHIQLGPVQTASGQVELPGSKSISNRVLLLAALCRQPTEIKGLLNSDDTRVMLAGLQQLGVDVHHLDDGQVRVCGAVPFPVRTGDLFLGNAGTAFRPLTAVLALQGGNYTLSGVARMHERPIGDLVDTLRTLGADIRYLGNEGFPPLAIGTGQVCTGEPVRVRGSVSSQFLTALLMAAPMLAEKSGNPVVIDVDGDLISKPYIHITLSLMARFGVKVQQDGWQRFVIPAGASYVSPGTLSVEGDASTASYFMAMGAIGGGPIHIHGVGKQSIQGDVAFTDTLQAMGVDVVRHANAIEVRGVHVAKGEKLRAFDCDFNLIPDAAMTAAALAMFADGPCMLRNIGSWRVKETDRIHAMHTELTKLGAKVDSGADWLRVQPVARQYWRSADIATYDDHRMAMCFSLAAFGPNPVTILDPACVGKTFPDYFSVFQGLVHA